MSVRTPNAVYIGAEADAFTSKFQKLKKDWNWYACDSIQSYLDEFNRDENGEELAEPADFQVIILNDFSFDHHPTSENHTHNSEFEDLIVSMSPYCLMIVLSYHPQWMNRIQQVVSNHPQASDQTVFYFIDPRDANSSIRRNFNNTINLYLNSPETSDQYTVAVLSGIDPEAPVDDSEQNQNGQWVDNGAPIKVDEYQSYYEDETAEKSDYLGQVIACTSSKGGSGKSTVAISLATYLAHASQNSVAEGLEKRPLKIVVLDLDVRDGQIGFLTGTMKPNVLNMRSNGINEASLASTVIHSNRLGVDLLLAPKKPRLSDDTPPSFYADLIQFLRRRYDYVILDTSVNYLDPLLEHVAYPMADAIVFVTDIVVNSVYSMTRWVMEVTRPVEENGMGIPMSKVGVVVNKSIAGVNMSGEKLQKAAVGIPIITVIPNNAKLMAHAANLQSMESVLRHEEIRKAIRRLARALVGDSYTLSENVIN